MNFFRIAMCLCVFMVSPKNKMVLAVVITCCIYANGANCCFVEVDNRKFSKPGKKGKRRINEGKKREQRIAFDCKLEHAGCWKAPEIQCMGWA